MESVIEFFPLAFEVVHGFRKICEHILIWSTTQLGHRSIDSLSFVNGKTDLHPLLESLTTNFLILNQFNYVLESRLTTGRTECLSTVRVVTFITSACLDVELTFIAWLRNFPTLIKAWFIWLTWHHSYFLHEYFQWKSFHVQCLLHSCFQHPF